MTARYTLNFLAKEYTGKETTACDIIEFRLLCSGALYRGNVETADWRKSDITRILLDGACKLRVTSEPIDDYPQELVLLLPAPRVTETKVSKAAPGSQVITSFRPDI